MFPDNELLQALGDKIKAMAKLTAAELMTKGEQTVKLPELSVLFNVLDLSQDVRFGDAFALEAVELEVEAVATTVSPTPAPSSKRKK